MPSDRRKMLYGLSQELHTMQHPKPPPKRNPKGRNRPRGGDTLSSGVGISVSAPVVTKEAVAKYLQPSYFDAKRARAFHSNRHTIPPHLLAATADSAEANMGSSVSTTRRDAISGHTTRKILRNSLICAYDLVEAVAPNLLHRVVSIHEAQSKSNAELYVERCLEVGCPVSPSIAEQMSTTPGRRELVDLDCNGTFIGDAGLQAVLPVIAANRSLQTLGLRACSLHQGIVLLLPTLRERGIKLHSLDISCNDLSPGTYDCLFHYVSNTPELQRLGAQRTLFNQAEHHELAVTVMKNRHALPNPPPPRYPRPSVSRKDFFDLIASFDEIARADGTIESDVFAIKYPAGYTVLRSNKNRSDLKRKSVGRGPPKYYLAGLAAAGIHSQHASKQDMAFHGAELRSKPRNQAEREEVERADKAASVGDRVSIIDFLHAMLPNLSKSDVIDTIHCYSEYTMVNPVHKSALEIMQNEQIKEIEAVFDSLDADGDGKLSCADFDATLSEAGKEAAVFVSRLNGVESITKPLFVSMMAHVFAESKRRRVPGNRERRKRR